MEKSHLASLHIQINSKQDKFAVRLQSLIKID